jgi:allophanate hydrolase subunit 1
MEEEVYSHYSGSRSPSPSESGTQYARRACNSTTWIHEEVKDMGSKLAEHITHFNEVMEEVVPAVNSLSTEARVSMMQNKATVQRVSALEQNLNARLDIDL